MLVWTTQFVGPMRLTCVSILLLLIFKWLRNPSSGECKETYLTRKDVNQIFQKVYRCEQLIQELKFEFYYRSICYTVCVICDLVLFFSLVNLRQWRALKIFMIRENVRCISSSPNKICLGTLYSYCHIYPYHYLLFL